MFARTLTPLVVEALSDTPVVLINGARQTGKTTLVRGLHLHPESAYISLDDGGFAAAARADPMGFVAGLPDPVVIDEVQHAPELFPAIKLSVDLDRRPGRFLLTGSANVLLLPRLSESLAGRIEILTLMPLSQAEIEGRGASFVDELFAHETPRYRPKPIDRAELTDRLLRGGFPEPLARADDARRRAWFVAYVTTILQRDVRDIANIDGLTELPRLLSLLAARAGGLLNLADISRSAGMPYTTLHRYISLLEATFLIRTLPAYSTNISRRLMKTPKLVLNDSGLMAHLLGLNSTRLGREPESIGRLLENFIANELLKDASTSATRPALSHYRTQAGQEVDLVLEDASGRLVGVEVKASATVGASDFKGLKSLEEVGGKRFARGVVLYTGVNTIPFGKNLHAVPVGALWQQ